MTATFVPISGVRCKDTYYCHHGDQLVIQGDWRSRRGEISERSRFKVGKYAKYQNI